jgi:hypothetical protein
VRHFWVRGRLSWPFLSAVVFFTLSVLVGDYVWRVVVMPFPLFLIYFALGDCVAGGLLIAIYFVFLRPKLGRSMS